jgi:hypothetical protein
MIGFTPFFFLSTFSPLFSDAFVSHQVVVCLLTAFWELTTTKQQGKSSF